MHGPGLQFGLPPYPSSNWRDTVGAHTCVQLHPAYRRSNRKYNYFYSKVDELPCRTMSLTVPIYVGGKFTCSGRRLNVRVRCFYPRLVSGLHRRDNATLLRLFPLRKRRGTSTTVSSVKPCSISLCQRLICVQTGRQGQQSH